MSVIVSICPAIHDHGVDWLIAMLAPPHMDMSVRGTLGLRGGPSQWGDCNTKYIGREAIAPKQASADR